MEDWGSVLISWEKVYQGRKEGGLDVLGIEIHNKAFLMKHIHKFFYHFDLPWVNIISDSYYSDGPPDDRMVGSFWWKSVLKLMPHFKIVTHCQIGEGETILLWCDKWNAQSCANIFPKLHIFVISNYTSSNRPLSAQILLISSIDLFLSKPSISLNSCRQ